MIRLDGLGIDRTRKMCCFIAGAMLRSVLVQGRHVSITPYARLIYALCTVHTSLSVVPGLTDVDP